MDDEADDHDDHQQGDRPGKRVRRADEIVIRREVKGTEADAEVRVVRLQADVAVVVQEPCQQSRRSEQAHQTRNAAAIGASRRSFFEGPGLSRAHGVAVDVVATGVEVPVVGDVGDVGDVGERDVGDVDSAVPTSSSMTRRGTVKPLHTAIEDSGQVGASSRWSTICTTPRLGSAIRRPALRHHLLLGRQGGRSICGTLSRQSSLAPGTPPLPSHASLIACRCSSVSAPAAVSVTRSKVPRGTAGVSDDASSEASPQPASVHTVRTAIATEALQTPFMGNPHWTIRPRQRGGEASTPTPPSRAA